MKDNSNAYDLEALEDIEFSDYPLTEDATPCPSSPFELPCSCVEDLIDYPSLESDFPSDTHSEALAALHQAESEQRRDFDRQRVVIRYRVRESVPVFRSSSVPAGPVSPTPTRRCPSQPDIYSSPEFIPDVMNGLSSSPPRLTDTTPKSLPVGQKMPHLTQRFVPTFSKPLSGGLLDFSVPGNGTSAASLSKPLPKVDSVLVVTSSGESLSISRKISKKVTEATEAGGLDPIKQTSTTPSVYYGVPISSLMDHIASDKLSCPTDLADVSAPPACNLGRRRKILWTEKYRAKRFTDLVGDERTHRHVMHWLKSWDTAVFGSAGTKRSHNNELTEQRKILLLHGPPGLGKTTLAHVAARQAGYEPVEINASDDRSAGVVKGKIKDILSTEGIKSLGLETGSKQAVDRRPLCLVIDEIDGVAGGQDGGFVQALIGLINADQKSRNPATSRNKRSGRKDEFRLCRPIIAVCNDLYAPTLKPLRQVAEIVQMRSPPRNLVEERLEEIFHKEGIPTANGAVRRLVELSSLGSSSGHSGDIRAALVNSQWIAARLKSTGHPDVCLTRTMVEEELGGKGFAKGDGKRSNRGRFGTNDVLEAVFHVNKNTSSGDLSTRSTTADRVQELVESLGEFEKITTDCFASYPIRPFNDDFRLSKPNAAYEWLWFADFVSSRQTNELSPYLSLPIVAFHHLFANPTSNSSRDVDSSEDLLPFNGPNADWEAREVAKYHSSIIQAVHSSLNSIRLSQTFKSWPSIVTELAPYLNLMVSPNISPVVIRGKDGMSVSSVRRDTEKILVLRAVNAMEATGVRFEKVRVETGLEASQSWAFRMDPSVDSLSVYQCRQGQSTMNQPVRYAVRQVLEQERQKARILREQVIREARMGAFSQLNPTPAITAPAEPSKRARSDKKRDFFGRVVEANGKDNTPDSAQKRRKIIGDFAKQAVWIGFHEGYSNAVRKPIRLAEILQGL